MILLSAKEGFKHQRINSCFLIVCFFVASICSFFFFLSSHETSQATAKVVQDTTRLLRTAATKKADKVHKHKCIYADL